MTDELIRVFALPKNFAPWPRSAESGVSVDAAHCLARALLVLGRHKEAAVYVKSVFSAPSSRLAMKLSCCALVQKFAKDYQDAELTTLCGADSTLILAKTFSESKETLLISEIPMLLEAQTVLSGTQFLPPSDLPSVERPEVNDCRDAFSALCKKTPFGYYEFNSQVGTKVAGMLRARFETAWFPAADANILS